MDLSERIRRWREGQDGLTKSELARRCGVSPEAVLQWENGDTNPTTPHLDQLVTALGVSMAVFFGEPPADRTIKRKKVS